ncbi:MAG: hypothetical protein ACYTXT_02045 [Nostoc sp.]
MNASCYPAGTLRANKSAEPRNALAPFDFRLAVLVQFGGNKPLYYSVVMPVADY